TTKMTVSDRSNRAVLSTLTENPAEVDVLFTAGGQQNQLQPGQDLVWTPRGELLKVAPVVRNGQVSDQESYRYDADSQRIIKTHVQQTANSSQAQSTLYLPELERHTTTNGTTVKEVLHVITIGEAGRAQVRVLHWEAGKPDGVSNNQPRYSYDNLIGSSGLEVDGDGQVISLEEYYPYGGTAVWMARNQTEADYKTVRYSGKERDATGLYYYGYRYYQPWAGQWLSADPAGTVDGLNLFRMVRNNPVTNTDEKGLFTFNTRKIMQAWTDRKAERRANKSYENMHNGTLWNKEIKDKKSFDILSKSNLEQLKKQNYPLTEEAHNFIQNFNNLDFNLVHFSNADLINEGQAIFRSRVELLRKKIIFPTENTDSSDIKNLSTDDFSFFSLNVGDAAGKNSSRFGSKRYDTPLEKVSQYKYIKHSHMVINDTLFYKKRQTSESRLKNKFNKNDTKTLLKEKISEKASETVYSYEHFKEGLALRIVNSAKSLTDEGQKYIFGIKNNDEFDGLISLLYRPQFLVPKKMVSKDTSLF
ncbi:RHS repeat-associated core domain-containing protein, partial [Xenorhabdus bovienii]